MSMSGEISRSCEISEDLVRSQFILLGLSRSREIPEDLMRSQTKLYYNQSVYIRLAHRLYTDVQYIFLMQSPPGFLVVSHSCDNSDSNCLSCPHWLQE